jgi:tripartite-type tricarboxylate transporter receptor subunit TctC
MLVLRGMRAILGLLAMVASGASALAADPYPAKPITIVIPYGAGSLADLVPEVIQPALEADLGQRILLDHRPGAGGNIGSDLVRAAPPDGYHLLLAATNNLVINQYLYAGKMNFDPLTAFAPVSMIVDVPLMITVNPGLPVTTMKEFVAYGQAHPGGLNFGSPGAGTIPHLATEILGRSLGLKAVHVAYKGGGPALAALLANEIQFMFIGFGTVADQVRAGTLRPIALAADRRLAALPDVPTFAEAGYPDLGTPGNWWGLVAPRGTDPAVVGRLAAAVRKAVTSPEAQAKYARFGLLPVGSAPGDFAARLPGEAATWQKIVAELGLSLE